MQWKSLYMFEYLAEYLFSNNNSEILRTLFVLGHGLGSEFFSGVFCPCCFAANSTLIVESIWSMLVLREHADRKILFAATALFEGFHKRRL